MGIPIALKWIKRSSSIGLFGGNSKCFEEVSLFEYSSDEDGDEGGGVGGGTPTSWLSRCGYFGGCSVVSNNGLSWDLGVSPCGVIFRVG